jgi:predicted metal-dependent hydrolase
MMPSPELEVRNLRFDVSDEVPRYWHGGRRAVTLFFDNLSIFFPAGERFFIAAVKAHAETVHDEQLLVQVRAFCAQEGIHGREHIRLNDMLRRQGYPVEAMERRVERLLARVTRRTTPSARLAATCALEHFTALLAHFLLSNDRLLDGAHPVMAALWRWHAAEENEHKAVAYDVYRQAGGGYLERAGAMVVATVIFCAKVFEHQIRLMWADGVLFSARQWFGLFRFLFIAPGRLTTLIRPYFRYYRPSFHPWQHDNRELLEAWNAELEASPFYEQGLGGRASPSWSA